MTPHRFIEKWRASELKERSASQEHFIDLCRLLGEPTPAEADPSGDTYCCFERGARKDTGGDGWADGTLFERGLDPGKRAQFGAHYTDRDKIMLIVEPVVIRPWLAEWTAEKAGIAAELERAEVAKSPAARTKRRDEAERRYRTFLEPAARSRCSTPPAAPATSCIWP